MNKNKKEYTPLKLRELPFRERPREKMIAMQAQALSHTELLAILLHTGSCSESVLQMAERVLQEAGGITGLSHLTTQQLMKIKGIGVAKATAIAGAVELGKRINTVSAVEKKQIVSPNDVVGIFMPRLRYEEKECFYTLLLSTKNTVIGDVLVSVGNLNSSIVHAREVFRAAINKAAAHVIIVHNHPSGEPAPSKEDVNITKQLIEAGKIIGIAVIDHIIIGDGVHYSFRDNNLI